MLTTLIIVSFFFWSSGFVFSLIIPYYELDPNATLMLPFQLLGIDWAIYPISIAAIVAMGSGFEFLSIKYIIFNFIKYFKLYLLKKKAFFKFIQFLVLYSQWRMMVLCFGHFHAYQN